MTSSAGPQRGCPERNRTQQGHRLDQAVADAQSSRRQRPGIFERVPPVAVQVADVVEDVRETTTPDKTPPASTPPPARPRIGHPHRKQHRQQHHAVLGPVPRPPTKIISRIGFVAASPLNPIA